MPLESNAMTTLCCLLRGTAVHLGRLPLEVCSMLSTWALQLQQEGWVKMLIATGLAATAGYSACNNSGGGVKAQEHVGVHADVFMQRSRAEKLVR